MCALTDSAIQEERDIRDAMIDANPKSTVSPQNGTTCAKRGQLATTWATTNSRRITSAATSPINNPKPPIHAATTTPVPPTISPGPIHAGKGE